MPMFQGKPTTEFLTQNPFKGPSVWMHVKASVLKSIWPSVLFYSGLAAMIVILDIHMGYDIGVQSTMLTVLGTTLGFIITYRTNSAYDRYYEGRKLWSSIIATSRTFARLVWFHVPDYITPPANLADVSEEEKVKVLIEKKTMINLVEAYAIATKHYLRGEQGVFYRDLWPLVCFIPKYSFNTVIERRDDMRQDSTFSTAFSEDLLGRMGQGTSGREPPERHMSDMSEDQKIPPASTPMTSTTPMARDRSEMGNGSQIKPGHRGVPRPSEPLRPAANPPPFSFFDDLFPIFTPIRHLYKFLRRKPKSPTRPKKRRLPVENENIPLEITLLFSGYVATLNKRKAYDTVLGNNLMASVLGFTNILTDLERILTTPIPIAYTIHLQHIIWIYLCVLPFQLVGTLKWVTIPAVAFMAFIYLGLMDIGEEIQNPFGYDDNDLDLGTICHNIISREMWEITSHTSESQASEDFIFSTMNVPFRPAEMRDAKTLMELHDQKQVEKALVSRPSSMMAHHRWSAENLAEAEEEYQRDEEQATGLGEEGEHRRATV